MPAGRWHSRGGWCTVEYVDPITLLAAIAFPMLLFIGGLAAWQMTRHRQTAEEQQTTWRDDSLDDWMREREAQAERERAERLKHRVQYDPEAPEQQEEAIHHQRIGG